MEDLAQRSLKYGDTIYLKVDGKQAFVSGHDKTTPQIRIEELTDAADSPPELKDCLFQVTKKFQYTQKKALLADLTQQGLGEDVLGEVQKGADAASSFEDLISESLSDPRQRHRLCERFSNYSREMAVNEEEFLQVAGEPVLYGHVVQLRHVATGKFVTIKRTAADVERGALKVVLEAGGHEGSWFQVFSGYRTKPEGAKLMPGEVVALKGLALSGNGLHISTNDIKDPAMLPVDKHPYITASKEVSASPDVAAFKIIPFSVHPKLVPGLNERLCGMSAVSIQDLVANTVFINLLGAINDKYLYFESPLTRPNPSRVGGPDSWRLELVASEWCGMPLSHACQIRIRHLPTGTYLAALSDKAKAAAKKLRDRRMGNKGASVEAPAGGMPTGGAGGAEGGLQRALKGAVGTDEDVLQDEEFRLVLTKRYNVPDTVWELHTFSKEDVVGTKVYAFFKHVATQFWLSGAGPPIPQPPSADPDDPQEEQFYPVIHPEKLERNVMLVVKLDDGFTNKVLDLQRVGVLLKELRHVLHKEKIAPEAELLALLESDQEPKVLEALAATQYPDKFRLRYPAVRRALKDLMRWLDAASWNDDTASSPHVEYQHLLRELGLIDLLAAYMEAARVRVFAAAPKLRHTRLGLWVIESGKQCHRILQLCCNGNELNQAYLVRHSAMVMSHLSSPLTAPDTLAAMYEDNMSQMQSVSPDIVAASVQLIRVHGHMPRFINFLRQICGTRERPMPTNQNWLVAETVGAGHDPLDVFLRAGPAALPDGSGQSRDTWVITCRRADDKSQVAQVDVSAFTGTTEDLTKQTIQEWDLSGEEPYSEREMFIYYCYSLQFVVALCNGRNSLARDQILAASREHGLGLEFDALRAALANERLPTAMRSIMVQVLAALYVDVEPYTPLKLPRHIRMLSKSGPTSATLSSAPVSDSIKQLIHGVLEQLRAVVRGGHEEAAGGMLALAAKALLGGGDGDAGLEGGDEALEDDEERGLRTVGRNSLVLQLLKMVREMFRLGMMDLDTPVTQDVLATLLEVLQKMDSLPLTQPGRFHRGYASKVVMEAKKVALQTLEFALDMKSEQQCNRVFERFARWQRSPERQEYWARRQQQTGANRAKASNLAKAAGGFLSVAAGIRAAASLGGTNKVAPAPRPAGQGNDPEAPPPRDSDADGEGEGDMGGLPRWVEDAYALLAADNEDDDFALFKLDMLNDGGEGALGAHESSPVTKLLDLVRYDDPFLTAKAFQLMERLTSKREKLVSELMRTYVVTDEDLIALSQWAAQQVEAAHLAFNYMGSLVPAESSAACTKAAAALDALTSLLVPLQQIAITLPDGTPDRVFISKATAANCQFMLYDMQVHNLALKFLKLPLARQPSTDPHLLQEAADPYRKEVFRACLSFLRSFMVVGDLDGAGAQVPSRPNQAAVLPSLGLIASFLDTKGLPASDTIIALFIKNQADAAKEGELVIRKLVKLIIRYGDKQNAGWLELLGKVMVVDGQPIKRNQMIAMQLITQYDEQVLSLMAGDEGAEQFKGLIRSERLSAKASADPPVGMLAYHAACVTLLAECCYGKEPELVVKASGYMSLGQVIDVLLMQPTDEALATNLRYVQRAYWRLLHHCYFATDTENTKVQVRNGTNRMWPLKEEATPGATSAPDMIMARFLDIAAPGGRGSKKSSDLMGGGSLMQAVADEVERALADPSDALANADSATFFLTTVVFPALQEYFSHHWHAHVHKLPLHPEGLLKSLFARLVDLYGALKRLKDTASSPAVKSELKMALANTRNLLAAMPSEANATGKSFNAKAAGAKASVPSLSQSTALTPSSPQVVQQEWTAFTRRLAATIQVEVDVATNRIVEVRRQDDLFAIAASSLGVGESVVFKQASLLRLARLLASPFGRQVPGSSPPMCFEDVTRMLCELLASRHAALGPPPAGWPAELLVKLVRTVRAAVVIDDGHGAVNRTKLRNDWTLMGLLYVDGQMVPVDEYEDPSDAMLEWRLTKYDRLGATRAALTLLAHPMPEVQLEALELLKVLLLNGSRTVQDTIYQLLNQGNEVSAAVFANFKSAFERCRKYVVKRSYASMNVAKAKKAGNGLDAAKALKGAALAALAGGGKLLTGGTKVAGLLGKVAVGTVGKVGKAAVAGVAGAASAVGDAAAAAADGAASVASKGRKKATGTIAAAAPAGAASRPGSKPASRQGSLRASSGRGLLGEVGEEGGESGQGASRAASRRAGPVAEGAEDASVVGDGGNGGEDEEEEEEEEMVWQDKAARLNDADNAYKFTSVLLEALRLMVEGHNKNMQTLLQSQPLSTSPLDLVLEAVELLSVLQDHVPTALASNDDEVANLMVLVCGFLQEMVQGPCLSNQQALSGTDFLASCNRIFGCIEYGDRREPGVDDRHMNANKCAIKDSLLRLLMSLLEASPNSLIPDRCYEILDFGSIDRQISRLCRVLGMMGEDGPAPLYDEEEEEALKKDEDDLTIVEQLRNELLSLCAFMLKLNAVTPSRPPPLPYLVALYSKSDVERLEDLTPDQRLYAADLQAFLTGRLGYVEINWAGHIEPCFFPLTKECSNVVTSAVWCEVTLDRLHNTVSPDSRAFPTVKAAELVDVLEAVVDDIELEAKLTRTRWLKAVSVMAQYRMVLLEATFYLAVATLIFQALADARWGPHTAWEERGYSWKTIVLSVAVMTQSACTVLLYLSFVYTDLSKFMSHEVSVTAEWLSKAGATVMRVLTFWRGKDAAGKDGGGKDAGHSDGVMAARKLGLSQPPTDERRSWLDWVCGSAAAVLTVMRCSKFWYFNMLVTASFAGFFVSPFFLVFHFTIYFLDFDSGKQLVLAIERSGINILNTFVLAVLAIYVFAVVTFLVFTDPTDADKGDGPPCGTFYQCMGAHMLTGIMGDISSLFNSDLWDTVPEKVNEDGLQQARTIVVLVFFMLWNFVLSNIFVGLIASAFEAIRDDQNTITSDRLSKCLVCSLDMYTFNEMIQGGFEEHIDKQHNALMYVFFLHHLRSTEPEDYAGAESVVARVLATAKTSTDKGTWLPVSRSLAVMHASAANGKGSGGGGGGGGGAQGE